MKFLQVIGASTCLLFLSANARSDENASEKRELCESVFKLGVDVYGSELRAMPEGKRKQRRQKGFAEAKDRAVSPCLKMDIKSIKRAQELLQRKQESIRKKREKVDKYIALLKTGTSQVRLHAISELRRLRHIAAVDPLIDALQDNEEEIKIKAIRALGVLEYTRSVEPLITDCAFSLA